MQVQRLGQQLVVYTYNDVEKDLVESLGGIYSAGYCAYMLSFSDEHAATLKKHGARLDPIVEALIAPRNTWLDVKPLDIKSRRPLMAHQKQAARLLVEQEKFMLSHEMGTGKTKTAVDSFHFLYKNKLAKYMLVVTDATMVSVWVNQLIPEDSCLPVTGLYGSASERRSKLRWAISKGYVFFVVNYDGVPVIQKELQEICNEDWVLVMDESQRVKDHMTKRFRAIEKLVKAANFKYIWQLTGTPLTQKPEDIFGQYAILEPKVYGDRTKYLGFRATYTISRSMGNGAQIVTGYKNMDLFMSKLHSKCHRVLRKDVVDLPPKTYQDIYLDMHPKLYKVYMDFINSGGMLYMPDHPKADSDGYLYVCDHPFSILAKSRQIPNNFIYLSSSEDQEDTSATEAVRLFEDIPNPKVEWLLQAIEDTEYQWIVWFAHRADKIELELGLARAGISFNYIDGTVPIQLRSDIAEEIRKGKKRVFLGQQSAASTGITLVPYPTSQYQGQAIMYYTNSYKCGNRQQSEDRTHRIGLDKDRIENVPYYDLLYKQTIEVSIRELLRRRIELNTMLTNKETLKDAKLMALLSGTINVR